MREFCSVCVLHGEGTGGGGYSGSAHASYSGTESYPHALYQGTVRISANASGTDDWSYNFGYTATLGSGGWSYTGTGTSSVSGSHTRSFAGSGTYDSGFVHGTLGEAGSESATYDSTLNYTLQNGGCAPTSGVSHSAGSGAYSSEYAGSGSQTQTSSSTSGGSTTSSTTHQSISENGFDRACYSYSTTSTYQSGSWATTGNASTWQRSH